MGIFHDIPSYVSLPEGISTIFMDLLRVYQWKGWLMTCEVRTVWFAVLAENFNVPWSEPICRGIRWWSDGVPPKDTIFWIGGYSCHRFLGFLRLAKYHMLWPENCGMFCDDDWKTYLENSWNLIGNTDIKEMLKWWVFSCSFGGLPKNLVSLGFLESLGEFERLSSCRNTHPFDVSFFLRCRYHTCRWRAST